MKRSVVALLSFIVPVAAFVILATTAVGDADAAGKKGGKGKGKHKGGEGDPPSSLVCVVPNGSSVSTIHISIPPGEDGAAELVACIELGGHPEGVN